MLSDDAKGVGEALNETAYGEGIIARGKHYLIYTKKTNQIGGERLLQNEVFMPNWLFFDDVSSINYNDWRQRYTHSVKIIITYKATIILLIHRPQFQSSSLKTPLPQNVHLMTYEPWKDDDHLIRFEHLLDKYDDAELSKPVTFDLKDVFPGDYYFEEVSLAGNQWIEESSRLRFRQVGSPDSGNEKSLPKLALTSITLEPMQIRTFIMTTTPRSDGIQHLMLKSLLILVGTVIAKNFWLNL